MIKTIEQAYLFVKKVKICTIFSSEKTEHTSLYENVDLPEKQSGESGWGEVTAVWTWNITQYIDHMKPKLISVGLLLMIISCNTQQNVDQATLDTDEKSDIESESSVVYDSSDAIWGYELNRQTEEYELKQLRSVDRNTLAGESLEKIINATWPKIEIKFIKTSNDTAFISIPDSRVLTQQIGSAGAMSFMSSTTYSFTELKGIDHVSFEFEEGDHAVPGVYDRKSWDGYSGS